MSSLDRQSILQKTKDSWANLDRNFILFIVFAFILITALMAFGMVPQHASWEVGKVASQDLIADRSISYVDSQATQVLKDEALASFQEPKVIDMEEFNQLTLGTFDSRYDRFVQIMYGGEGQEERSAEDKRQALAEELKLTFSDNQWQQLQRIGQDRFDILRAHVVSMLSEAAGDGVSASEVAEAETGIRDRILGFSAFNDTERIVFLGLLDGVSIYPTAKVDQRASDQQKNALLNSIEPVRHTIQKGQLVVSRGDVISSNQHDAIKALDYTSDASVLSVLSGLVIVVLLVFALLSFYLQYFLMAHNVRKWRKWYLMILTVLVMVVASFPLIMALSITGNEDIANQVGFLIPIPAAAMMIGVLIGGRVAVLTLTMATLLLGLYTGNVYFMVAAVAGGMSGIVQTKRLRRRGDLNLASLYIAFAVGLVVLAHGLINGLGPREILVGMAFAIGNGLLSVVLAVGFLPFIESAFRITTALTLLELADPSNSLLRRLSEEAPGTYHHSILVANLAENAAIAIEADSLLVRTAAYYHDVGKLKRPAFFSENQMTGVNPHDKIGASLSNLIITAHVKDGVALAREANIPEAIVELIDQHHGDTVVAYFYNKAQQEYEDIAEENFRYHHKKPQSREAAILMMADTVEAAVRSQAGKLNSGEISGFIRQLIDAKEADGQFEECDLTFRDLRKIGDAFTKIMTGVYHKRIEYPDQKQLANHLES